MVSGEYTYSKLDVESQEIRLVTLLSGMSGDPLRLSIFHVPFVVPIYNLSQGCLITKEHQNNLAPGWIVSQTLDRRIIYLYEDDDPTAERSSWTHPDPKFQYNNNEKEFLQDLENTQLEFEALSYTWGSRENQELAYLPGSSDAPEKTLVLGRNLACALKDLRYADKTRTLWVDAIWY